MDSLGLSRTQWRACEAPRDALRLPLADPPGRPRHLFRCSCDRSRRHDIERAADSFTSNPEAGERTSCGGVEGDGGQEVTIRMTPPLEEAIPLPEHLQPTPTTLDMRPGPQPWNAGITPQRYLDQFGPDPFRNNPPASRTEVTELRESLYEVALAVARMETLLARRL